MKLCSDPCVHFIDAREAEPSIRAVCEERGWHCQMHSAPGEFFAHHQPRPAECLLVNLTPPRAEHGLALLHQLWNQRWTIPVIGMASNPSVGLIVQAMQAGARDFADLPPPVEPLANKLGEALEFDRLNKAVHGFHTAQQATLTPREREVQALLLEARTIVQIAHRLGISVKTAEKHRANLMEKLGVASVPELMRLHSPPRDPRSAV